MADSINNNQNDENINSSGETEQKAYTKVQYSRINNIVLLSFLLLGFIFISPIIGIFVIPIILAITFVAIFFPFYKFLIRLFRGSKPLGSIVCCVFLLIGVLVPLYGTMLLIVNQAIDVYNYAAPTIQSIIQERENSEIIKKLTNTPFFKWIQLRNIDWGAFLEQIASRVAGIGTFILNFASASVFGLLLNVFVMFFTMFYLFIDGESIVKRVKYLIPLKTEYQETIINRFLLISRATLKSTFVIGVVQGVTGGLVLLLFGVNTWVLWGVVMVFFSIIPMVGTWLVLLPAGIIQIALGNTWQGIGIILSSTLIVSNIDNVLRPRLVGHDAQMHDLLVFFSTIGGITVFGVTGFIIGPALAAFFVSVLDIYAKEFETQLKNSKNGSHGAFHE